MPKKFNRIHLLIPQPSSAAAVCLRGASGASLIAGESDLRYDDKIFNVGALIVRIGILAEFL